MTKAFILMNRLGRRPTVFVWIFFTAISQILLAYASLYISNYNPVWSAPLWPASGAALAAVLLGGPWMLVGVFLGLIPSQLFFWGSVPTITAFLLPLANVVETALAWFLLRKVARGFNDRFSTQLDLIYFLVLAPWLPALTSALLGQWFLALTFREFTTDTFVSEVLVYAMGNASGMILITPLVLIWRDILRVYPKPERNVWVSLLNAGVVLAVVWGIQRGFYTIWLFMVLPPLVFWGVWSTGLRGASLNCCILSFLLFQVQPHLPFDQRLSQKHVDAPKIQTRAGDPDSLPQQLLQEPLALQFTLLIVFCITLYPLGLAADTLKTSKRKDQMMMDALHSSLWTWNCISGYQIESPQIAREVSLKNELFDPTISAGQRKVSTEDADHPSYLSHWTTTEVSASGAPQQVIGILHSLGMEEKVAAAEKSAAVAQMEIENLRSRLNPHLLFNCLTGLRTLILKNPTQARKFTEKLAQFLRAAVDTQNAPLITIQEEIDLCRSYLDLRRLSKSDFVASFQVDSNCLNVPVPPMTIHSLIENALKHGSRVNRKKLNIFISVHLHDQKLVILVTHPGSLNLARVDKPNGGIAMTRKHLALFFEKRASLHLLQASARRIAARVEIQT
jgi:integral membrane sensor domain MASE1